MSARRAGVVAAAAVLGLALIPAADSPLRRLAGGSGDGPDPIPDAPLDLGSLPQIAKTHSSAPYFVDAADEPPLVQGNLKALGQLYLARGFPVQDPAGAEYVLRVRGTRIVYGRRR